MDDDGRREEDGTGFFLLCVGGFLIAGLIFAFCPLLFFFLLFGWPFYAGGYILFDIYWEMKTGHCFCAAIRAKLEE
jgi:hypothetical protein